MLHGVPEELTQKPNDPMPMQNPQAQASGGLKIKPPLWVGGAVVSFRVTFKVGI